MGHIIQQILCYRTGVIQPGDKLWAIDNVRLDNCSIEDAAQIIESSGEIVKLRIQKDDAFSGNQWLLILLLV